MVITIDGPTASGKTTVAQLLAKKLNIYHLSSGMLFRALAYLLSSDSNYTEKSIKNVKKIDVDYYLNPEKFTYSFDKDNNFHIFFEKKDITPFLKDKKIDPLASLIATNEHVREHLLKIQQEIGKKENIIVDGRDSGSTVFPHAKMKFFLTASPEERAKRWQKMQQKRGLSTTFDEALTSIKERDQRDETRDISPLTIPHDAIVMDNSQYTIEETVNRIKGLIKTAVLLKLNES